MNSKQDTPPPLRILVVEDNPFDQLMCETILRGLGFPCMVVQVDSLAEGVKAAAAADLVLLDLNLPDAATGDALAAIGRFERPVLVMTGDDSPGRAFDAGRAGAAGSLSKFAAHSQLLPTVLFVAGLCAASGALPDPLTDAINRAYA